MVWLAEQRHERMLEVVSPFLKDFDEEVRYAAAEVLIHQEDDGTRDALLEMLANPDEESLRLRHRLAHVFRNRGWAVGDTNLAGILPEGLGVQGGRIVG